MVIKIKTTNFVVACSIEYVKYNFDECMLFPCNKDSKVLDFMELSRNHAGQDKKCLNDIGYIIEQ